jgi:hypothetical protein
LSIGWGNVPIEDVAGFTGDEGAEGAKTHTTHAANPAIGADAFGFGFECGFDGFAVQGEASGGEANVYRARRLLASGLGMFGELL